jgi:glycerophosphoryl diester phosphodiesterase
MMAAAAPRPTKVGREVFHPTTCALQVPATWYGMPVVSPGLVALAHSAGRLVHVWTVNGLDEVAALTGLGVDGLITDRPDLIAP